jgi:hypothetical protein
LKLPIGNFTTPERQLGREEDSTALGTQGRLFLRPEAGQRGVGFLATVIQASNVRSEGPGNCHSVGGTWSVAPDRGWGPWGLNCAVCGSIGRRRSRGCPGGLSLILHFTFVTASQLVMANEATLLLAHLLRLCPWLLLSRSKDPIEDDSPIVHQRSN